MSIDSELRELAYKIWRENGRNLAQTERTLKGVHRTPVSRVTLTKWCADYGWVERATTAEAKTIARREAVSVDRLIEDLIDRKEAYDAYFETLGLARIDNQATYAYAGLLKRIAEMQQMRDAVVGFDKPRFFLENLQWVVSWLKGHDPAGLQVIARDIDALTLAYKAELINGNA